MTYSSTNPPVLARQALSGARVFDYSSTDESTTVATLGYFTDGYERGMRAGDLLNVRQSVDGTVTSHLIISSSTPSTAGVVIGDPTTIGSTTNTA